MKLSIWKAFAVALCLFPLAACGGGGGDDGGDVTPAPVAVAQKAELTVGLQGSGLVGAVDVEILLPAGFTLAVDSQGQPLETALINLLGGGSMAVNYTPETVATNGQILIALVNSSGFAASPDLLKISRTYAAGATLPKGDDFQVKVEAFDLNGATLATLSPTLNFTTTPAP